MVSRLLFQPHVLLSFSFSNQGKKEEIVLFAYLLFVFETVSGSLGLLKLSVAENDLDLFLPASTCQVL